MKENIHPKYGTTKITCACGHEFETASTRKDIRVEVCSQCHPFFTGGKQRFAESGGRVERFRKKYGDKV